MLARFFLLTVAGALACGRDVEPARPTDSAIAPRTFVAVITELTTARVELLPDTAAYLARRDAILARHRVSAQDLRAFVESHGGSEDILAIIYTGIESRIDTTYGSEATVPPSTEVPPADEVETIQAPAESAPSAVPPTVAPDTTAPDTTAPEPRDLESAPDTMAAASSDSV